MKWSNLLITSIFTIGIFNLSLFADDDIDTNNMGSENIGGAFENQPASKSPFSFSAYADAVGKAKINKGFFKKDEIQFAIANAEIEAVYYYCPEYSEAANITLGYTETYIGWKENPWFSQTHFDTVTLSFGGITKRFDRWLWRGQVEINYDGFDELTAEYLNYNLILWGRYSICKDIGVHMGFYVETGMRMDRIYPIIGFDWQINRKWKLNAVFPFDMALEYTHTKNWTFALAGRTFSIRHRIQPNDSHGKYVCRYTNFGIEAMVKYSLNDLVANIHAGVTTGGDFKVANSHNHDPNHYHLDPAGYVGAEVDMRF